MSDMRSIRAVDAEEKPVIDGRINDGVWLGADWQGNFIQLKPSPGEPARARTEVAVAYDDAHIYAAFRCYNPTGPSANSKINRRDGNMDMDNAVTLYLDTFHTRRDCYYFSTNSLGTQVDGRIGEDGRSNDKNWDCTWQVQAREDSLGWTAEMAIPLGEIRFPESEDHVWGINFRRNYPEYYETGFWAERESAWRISQSGDLVGLRALKKHFSAALYPYAIYLNTNTPAADRTTVLSSGNSEAIAGADLLFDFGSGINGNVTYNPDFATVEADLDVINLTRYETFYPEKRMYFLEGRELFSTHFNVFHSRRIGDIDLGLKTNGRLGGYNFAVLSAHERSGVGAPASTNSVIRLQRDVLKSSNIGLLLVDRTAEGDYNRVISADATFAMSDGYRLTTQVVGGQAAGGDIETAGYLQFSRQTQLYNYMLAYTGIDPGFQNTVNPVGFIQDDDRRQLQANGGNEMWVRKYGIDKINTHASGNVFWSYGGKLRNVEGGGWVGVTFLDKWLLGFARNYHTEWYEKRFDNRNALWEMGYNQQAWNNMGFLHQWGRNFDSDFQRLRLRFSLKPSHKLAVSHSFTYFRLSPDPDKSSTNINFLTTDYNFTPNVWLRLIAQHSTRSDRIYAYFLFGWRFSPPFGAVYVAYTADDYDIRNDVTKLMRSESRRTFFIKMTLPVDVWK